MTYPLTAAQAIGSLRYFVTLKPVLPSDVTYPFCLQNHQPQEQIDSAIQVPGQNR